MKEYKFKDIAGYKQEKEELKNLAKALKNYSNLQEMGGRMPKGLLLRGANGVGKSYLAKAFIQECGIEAIELQSLATGKEYEEYVDEVFKKALKRRPCIILIEELDKMVAQVDMFSYGDDNYDRFSCLLNAINKYIDEDGIFILATANMEMRFDQSIIRSGRIDKIIKIDLPKQEDRIAIFKHYAKGKSIDGELNYLQLARTTSNFSGADIEAVMNEAVVIACNDDRKAITIQDIIKAINDKKFGCLEKESELNEGSQRVIATHESGHALMMLLGPKNSIDRVTILPRSSIRGYAEQSIKEEKVVSTNDKVHYLSVCLAGMVAEKLCYSQMFNGSYSDMRKALEIIWSLITIDGYKGFQYLFLECLQSFHSEQPLSAQKLAGIEEQQNIIFQEAYKKTEDSIKEHWELFTTLIDRLMVQKVLDKDDLTTILEDYLDNKGPEYKKKFYSDIQERFPDEPYFKRPI